MKVGDLLLMKPGTRVLWGGVKSSGIILEVREDPQITRWNGTPEIYLDILWVEGYRSVEDIRRVSPYYEVVPR